MTEQTPKDPALSKNLQQSHFNLGNFPSKIAHKTISY